MFPALYISMQFPINSQYKTATKSQIIVDCLKFDLKVKMMVRSMTGFGRAKAQIDSLDITVEIKSVNHRYFEFSARLPRSYNFLEEIQLSAIIKRALTV